MYIVIEIQNSGTASTIVSTYDTLNEAENKYHTILAYAAISNVPIHGATILTGTGEQIKFEYFEH